MSTKNVHILKPLPEIISPSLLPFAKTYCTCEKYPFCGIKTKSITMMGVRKAMSKIPKERMIAMNFREYKMMPTITQNPMDITLNKINCFVNTINDNIPPMRIRNIPYENFVYVDLKLNEIIIKYVDKIRNWLIPSI